MLKITVEKYGDVIAIQIPNSNRLDFIQSLKQVQANDALVLLATTGEQVSFKRSLDFVVNFTNEDRVSIELPPKDWTLLIEAVQEHLTENREFPLDHSFEPYGAKIIPNTIKDVVIETVDDNQPENDEG